MFVDMSQEFMKKWESEQKEGLANKLKSIIYPSPPLKPKIEYVNRMLDLQRSKLEQIYNRLYERDKRLFEYLVNYYLKHDLNRAQVYANEIASIRRLARIIMQSKLALEAVRLRLDTIKEMGDAATIMVPAINVIKSIRSKLTGVLPEAEKELTDIGNVINSVLNEAGQLPGNYFTIEAADEEAEKILTEAKTLAEKKLKEEFVEIPYQKEKEVEVK